MLDGPYRLHRRRAARLVWARAWGKCVHPSHTLVRVRTRWIGLVVAGALIIMSVGCVHVFPSRPWPPEYIINRAGDYYFGSRCSTHLTDAAVFDHDPGIPGSNSIAYETALWYGVALPSGVVEFRLFAVDQAGVAVVRDAGSRPYSQTVHVYGHDDRGQLLIMTLTLNQVAENRVATYSGPASWEEFMKRPTSDFGC